MADDKYTHRESDVPIASDSASASASNSYADVMYMLHSMPITHEVKEQVARRLTMEVTSKYLSKSFERLDHLAALKNNWDGEGALPISRKVINNVKNVLAISDDEDWEEWMIGPDGNATLGLQSKTTRAAISVGANEFSYFAKINGVRSGESHVAFTPEALLDVMRKNSRNDG